MKQFAFVILHYNTIDDTKACVESIRKYIKGASYHIIIVDNCSPNQSGAVLEEDYKSNEDITIILNSSNLGFARGNNVGFKYAKDVLHSDYIVLLNSDTELLEDNFIELIEREYNISNFAVLGPMIETPKAPYVTQIGRHTLMTRSQCVKSMFILSWYYLLSLVGLDIGFRKLFVSKKNKDYSSAIHKREENVQLHGCFLIFSSLYIEKFDGLNPQTFLYREEDLLFLRLKKCGLMSVYQPALRVFHKEQSATESLFNSEREKRKFGYKQRIISTFILFQALADRSM